MRFRRPPYTVWLLASVLAACGGAEQPATTSWTDPSPHTVGDIHTNGTTLNYLDWGGTGPALMLIHGLGDSPHVWDDLAPMLTGSFHVVAYARRGHAHSGMEGPYDNATLTDDLRGVLDSLAIDRVNLLGWSMGGNEITEFAIRYPERTAALVYLDAAYDWADPRLGEAFAAAPVGFTPSGPDLASLDAIRAWFHQTWLADVAWPAAWEAHLRDLVDVQADGSIHYRQSEAINTAMFESLMAYHKIYTKIQAPALALYAPVFFPQGTDSTRVARLAAWEASMFEPYRQASIERFRQEVRAGRDSLLPNTNHATIGVVDLPGLARLIGEFLSEHNQ